MMDPIEFEAAVAKVQTLADGGLRFTFDAPESALMAMAQLVACKQSGIYLKVICSPSERDSSGNPRESRKLKF